MFNLRASHRQHFRKVTLTFLFLLLSVALVITWNIPATNFEPSIYRSTPLILWVSLIVSVIVGVALVVVSIIKRELEQNSLWKGEFLLIYLCYTVCLALFIIRGYYMWCMGGDPGTHIGWIKETISTGHTAGGVIYPIIHIYLSEIVFLTGLDLIILHKIIPLIFSVLFIIYMYVLAKSIFSNTTIALLLGIVACSLFSTDFYLNLIPNGLSSLLLPLVLFVIFKYLYQRRLTWALVLIVLIIFYPVLHPVSTMFIGLTFLTLGISHTLSELAQYVREGKIAVHDLRNYKFKLILPLLIILTWFILWITSFRVWYYTVRSIGRTIFSEGTSSEITELLDTISYAQGYGYSAIEIGIKEYGVMLVLFALSILATLFLLRDFYCGRYEKPLLALLGPFGALLVIIPVLFLFDLNFNAFRFLHALTILMSILSAYALYNLLMYNRDNSSLRKTIFTVIFVIMIISGLFVGSLLSLYPSPYTLSRSYHNTHAEVAGMEYVYDHRDITTSLTGVSASIGRFADVFLTPEEKITQHLSYLEEGDPVPLHFGYDVCSSLSSAYNKEIELVIVSRGKALYIDIFPDMAQHRFTNQDFERLKVDPGINFVYSNGEFDFFKVTAIPHPAGFLHTQ